MRKIFFALFISALIVLVSFLYSLGSSENSSVSKFPEGSVNETVYFYLPWGDLGERLVENGVVSDGSYISDLGKDNGDVIPITEKDSKNSLNALWAFGLSNKSKILEDGPMTQYGNTGRFASTGGWTLSEGNSMNHYSKHEFIKLSEDQERLVARVSKNIFRPCCNNSTFFPDCNHGMAMLGLLQILASDGYNEDELYEAAFRANNLWFGSMYDSVVSYIKDYEGLDADSITPKLLVSKKYSSVSGYQNVLEKMNSQPSSSSCSV